MAKAKKPKRKNPGVGVDFAKVKQKVGRKLAPAANETNTTVKARTINLPSQSVGADKGDAAVTHRNLTLKDLLGQTSHHSKKVRKEALVGLEELLQKFPAELTQQAKVVLERLTERMSDPIGEVREQLSRLLGSQVLPVLGPSGLTPFLPILLVHVSSALTHLAPHIRLDGLGFLQQLLQVVPSQVVAQYESTALRHFAAMLPAASRPASPSMSPLSSLLQVAQALQAFLSAAANKAAVPQSQTADPVQPASIHHDAGTLFHARCAWPPIIPMPLDPPTWALSQSGSHTAGGSHIPGVHTSMASQAAQAGGLSSMPGGQRPAFHAPGVDNALRSEVLPAGNPSKRQKTGVTGSSGPLGVPIKAVFETSGARHDAEVDALRGALVEGLVGCFGECAPAQLETEPSLAGVQCLTAILACLNHLLAQPSSATSLSGRNGPGAALRQLLKRLTAIFPVHRPVVRTGPQLEAALAQLNLTAARLLATLASPSLPDPTGGMAVALPGWVEQLLMFLAELAAPGAGLPSREESASAKGRQGSVAQMQLGDALGAIEAVLPKLPHPHQDRLLHAISGLAQSLPPHSPIQDDCLQLQLRLLLQSHTPAGPWGGLQEQQIAAWIQPLPAMLTKLGASRPVTSYKALQLLHAAATRSRPGGPISGCLDALQPQLAALWMSPAVSAADADDAGIVRQPGPLHQLPFHCQMLAADVLHFLPAFQRPLLSALAFACNPPQSFPSSHVFPQSVRDASQYPQAIALRLLHCISRKSTSMLPEDFLSFLLTMLIGGDPSTTPPAGPLANGVGAEATADPNARSRGMSAAAGNGGREGSVAGWAARGELLKVLQACMTQSQAAGPMLEVLADRLVAACQPAATAPSHALQGFLYAAAAAATTTTAAAQPSFQAVASAQQPTSGDQPSGSAKAGTNEAPGRIPGNATPASRLDVYPPHAAAAFAGSLTMLPTSANSQEAPCTMDRASSSASAHAPRNPAILAAIPSELSPSLQAVPETMRDAIASVAAEWLGRAVAALGRSHSDAWQILIAEPGCLEPLRYFLACSPSLRQCLLNRNEKSSPGLSG